MAVLLLVLCVWVAMALIRPTTGPRRRGGRSAIAEFTWKNFPTLYAVYEKSLLLLGCIALLAGAAYCVKLALTP
ncbi:hypothetical protein [Archangium lipolyticum]|uniref:hypothetical protein n=1 Tax=Archangium lipolyticum TaxID=2970465 RepID=UPI00214A3189|nr:hypothetical protein [Archangium lipolyticum]